MMIIWFCGIALMYSIFGMESLFIYFAATAVCTMIWIIKEQVVFEAALAKEERMRKVRQQKKEYNRVSSDPVIEAAA